ncbi:hypothetical protein JTB14_006495 [Gonioctena quinquepunctata]|nr:hypothetical protein JTB14_006495 [Gonioctena quinquepunctata]
MYSPSHLQVFIYDWHQEFYNKHPNLILDSSRLQQSYEGCMEEVLHKYKSFLSQCEACRTENFIIFLSILNNLKSFKFKYLKAFRNTFYKLGIARITHVSDNILLELHEMKEDAKKKYAQIYKKLKVLYGHPNNRGLLESLRMEFESIVEDNEGKFDEITNPQIVCINISSYGYLI